MLKRLGAFFIDIIEVFVFAIAIFLFIYLLVMQPHRIKGSSMEPNLMPKDYLLSDKVSYRFREPERGEVIVFKAPGASGDEYIKRIIAVPGETIKVDGGKVYINDNLLSEKYLPNGLPTLSGSFLREGTEYTVPTDSYITFGDNRPVSSDSREWGIVPKEKITGRAWFLYWPIGRMGLIRKASY